MCPHVLDELSDGFVSRIDEQGDAPQARSRLLEELEQLASEFVAEVARPRNVATRLYEARDDSKLDRVRHADHHNRHRLRRLHEGASSWHRLDENQVGTLSDEFTCQRRQACVVAARRSRLQEHDVPTVGPPEFL